MNFPYPPTPQILHWLAAGQLGNRLHRSIRLWVILNKLYGEENWIQELPKNFTYSQLRDRLFRYNHPKSETISTSQISANCGDNTCICHQNCGNILQTSNCYLSELEWQQEIIQLTGITPEYLAAQIQQSPFATVHRSLRDDLKQLVRLGWLQSPHKGQYQSLPTPELPTPVTPTNSPATFTQLSLPQTWELLHALESISFVQPNLEIISQSLWEQILHTSPTPEKRIFLHLDYILSPEMQDKVDNYQEQLEQLWRKQTGGVIRFKTLIPATAKKVAVTVYPVCLHYSRRAKYLSAYGIDPHGNTGWHNYRLDRIASAKLQILAWGDPEIPPELQLMWESGTLPTPQQVEQELAAAWGFNFYLKREFLIMRFPPDFARWYVDNTVRHQSFKPVAYAEIRNLVKRNIPESQQIQVLEVLEQKSSDDAYYTAWIRDTDINVLMRLRDWRPKGEVIAPLSVREGLKAEAMQELENYQLSKIWI
ncbi:TIGR03985 family CRISPR-associated protein [Anabaena sp. UHCC 0253]|uniref:TIGR03985 family CRISPR-associated protein n=1 Tax=Anabaena sp. UHCC 0253 TaxID=2590019 RepID=UPI001446BC57|nr:TIGR03985 family CRISPR-associated protein [Anabaena sp. UHCC 0253]